MALIVRLTTRHNCREEIARDIKQAVWFATIVECSCGEQYIWADDQRDGPHWAHHPRLSDGR